MNVLSLSFVLACVHVAVAAGPATSSALAFVTPSSRLAPHHGGATRLKMSSLSEPDTAKFNNLIYASDDTVHLLREELKKRLLNAADDLKSMKTKEDEIARKAIAIDEESSMAKQEQSRWYVFRLLNRIISKILRKKSKNNGRQKSLSQSQGILTSDSFRQIKLDLGAAGDRVIQLAEQLSLLNPTPFPTLGFKQYGGAPPEESKLAGTWKLRFTTAADASFPESEKRGVATTSQVIDAKEGTLTNVVDFEKGKLKGFRVVVAGEPTSITDIDLSFKAVKIFRQSRFPRLFGQFTIRLPSRLIRWLASRNKAAEERSKGPYLQLRYLDENLRMHTTDSGNWFIQTRLG
jgi:hypothetical protein